MKKLIAVLALISTQAFATQPNNPGSPSNNNGPTITNINTSPTTNNNISSSLSNKNYVDIGINVNNKLTNSLSQKQGQWQGQSQQAIAKGGNSSSISKGGQASSTSNSTSQGGQSNSDSYSQASGNGGTGSSNVNISETSVTNIPKNTPSLTTLFGYGSQSPANCSNSVGGSAAAEGKGFSVLFPWQDEVCYFLLMADRLNQDADRFNNFKTKEVVCIAMKNENDPIADARKEAGYSCHDERLDNEAAFNRMVKEADAARQKAYLIAKEQLAKSYFDKADANFDNKIDQLFKVLLAK
jgi:hypothetical protein